VGSAVQPIVNSIQFLSHLLTEAIKVGLKLLLRIRISVTNEPWSLMQRSTKDKITPEKGRGTLKKDQKRFLTGPTLLEMP